MPTILDMGDKQKDKDEKKSPPIVSVDQQYIHCPFCSDRQHVVEASATFKELIKVVCMNEVCRIGSPVQLKGKRNFYYSEGINNNGWKYKVRKPTHEEYKKHFPKARAGGTYEL
jgi:hypothetical protein